MKILCHNCQQIQNVTTHAQPKCQNCNSEAVQFINQSQRQQRHNSIYDSNQRIQQRRNSDNMENLFNLFANMDRSPFDMLRQMDELMGRRRGTMMGFARGFDNRRRFTNYPQFSQDEQANLQNFPGQIFFYSSHSNPQYSQQPQVYIQPENNVKKIDVNELPTLTKITHECAICHIKQNEGVVLPCGHQFHKQCLKPWLQMKDNCPTCRKKL